MNITEVRPKRNCCWSHLLGSGKRWLVLQNGKFYLAYWMIFGYFPHGQWWAGWYETSESKWKDSLPIRSLGVRVFRLPQVKRVKR